MVYDVRPTTEKGGIGRSQRQRQQLAIVRQTGGSRRGPDYGGGGLQNARARLTRSSDRGDKFLTHKGLAASSEAPADSHAKSCSTGRSSHTQRTASATTTLVDGTPVSLTC